MISKKQEYKIKVEDRLLQIGQKWKEKKEEQLKDYLNEVDCRAYPVLTTIQSDKQTMQSKKH
jgi:uncharacterized phage-like protein YoqJ